MQANITTRTINALKPKEKPYEIRDTGLKGLLLRVQPSGVMTYYVEYARGKRKQIGRADTVTPFQAREKAKEILADYCLRGEDPETASKRKKVHTLKSFIEEEYIPWMRDHARGADATEAMLKRGFAALLNQPLSEINSWRIEQWKRGRKNDVKEATVNREFNALRACLRKAVARDFLVAYPLKDVKKYKEEDSKEILRWLTPEEEKRLRDALTKREERIRKARENGNEWREERGYDLKPQYKENDFVDHLSPMVLLSLNTGLRRGELFSLEWDDIDLKQGNLTVRKANAKSGKTRHIPLNTEAMAVLVRWQKQTNDESGLVFKNKDGSRFYSVKKAWDNLLDKENANITDFRWHDMRHTFASRLVQAKVELPVVRALLGHSSFEMTLRYAHINPEREAEAVGRLVGSV